LGLHKKESKKCGDKVSSASECLILPSERIKNKEELLSAYDPFKKKK